MTELYVFSREGKTLPESAERLLPPWRREIYDRLQNPAARQESLAAGLLWRYAMAQRGLPPAAEVTRLPAGKPVLAGRGDILFSLSHSGCLTLCAVSDRPVGADVQERRQVRLSMTRYFHPAEQDWFAEQGRTEEAFYRLWTRKEAWVKAVSGERMLSLAEADVIHPLPGLYFRDYALPGGFQAAVCCEEKAVRGPLWTTRAELMYES